MAVTARGWTYGVEHEWADWSIHAELPDGCAHNRKDYTVCNSNGIANDPTGRLYAYGGEINTRPTSTIGGQVDLMSEILDAVPEAAVNHRSNLHVHIRVPGLRDDLPALKRVQRRIHEDMPRAFDAVTALAPPSVLEYPDREAREGALARWRRRRVSHRTLLTAKRLEVQLAADTVDEFFAREVPRDARSRRPLWHLQPRCAVNLRQLIETDTIEFRHFPGTIERRELFAALTWCREFLLRALDDEPIGTLVDWARDDASLPAFAPYDHVRDVRFRATSHGVPRDVRAANIKAILDGTFTP